MSEQVWRDPRPGRAPPPGDDELDIQLPAKFGPLVSVFDDDGKRLPRKRYYVAYGGRDSAKSWSFARALILLSFYDPLRILCAREIQKTIADSVHRLLTDTIKALALERYFEIQEHSIANKVSGAEWLFIGLREQDAHKIKSYEGCDVVWVEEAQTVTKRSWGILIPTIRAEQSEIWATFNPELDTDDTYVRFVESPPDDPSWICKVGWEDNPWRSKVLDKDREKMRRDEPDEYAVIYGGNPRVVLPGAIYAREVTAMVQGGRYRPVPYDPRLLVHTIWDIGWNDAMVCICAQRVASEVRVIDYDEESFLRPDEWAAIVAGKGYTYGGHWLPHDGGHERLEAGGKSLKQQFGTLFRELRVGGQVHVVARVEDVELPIRAARQMFPRVYMDRDHCSRLMECLKRFRRAVPQSTGEPGAPMKDEYRHGADAFSGLARVVDKLRNEGERPMERVETYVMADPGVGR